MYRSILASTNPSYFLKGGQQTIRSSNKGSFEPIQAESSLLLDGFSNKDESYIFLLFESNLYIYDGRGRRNLDQVKIFNVFDNEAQRRSVILKLSTCGSLLAIVDDSRIRIYSVQNILKENALKIEAIVEFHANKNADYFTYFEWSPLIPPNGLENSFLTMDKKGHIRIYSVTEGEIKSSLLEEEEEKVYCCVTFSLDGKLLYAINSSLELCILDSSTNILLQKRQIEHMSNNPCFNCRSINQINSKILAVGSLWLAPGNNAAYSLPYMVLLFADLFDAGSSVDNSHFKLQTNKPYINLENQFPNNFSFIYDKQSELLFYTHSASSRIQVQRIERNQEHDKHDYITNLDLKLEDETTIKGYFAFNPALSSSSASKSTPNQTQNTFLRVVVLDSKGFLHYFDYYDVQYLNKIYKCFYGQNSSRKYHLYLLYAEYLFQRKKYTELLIFFKKLLSEKKLLKSKTFFDLQNQFRIYIRYILGNSRPSPSADMLKRLVRKLGNPFSPYSKIISEIEESLHK